MTVPNFMQFPYKNDYRKLAIITRYWFETALDYKPWILGKQIEELPCLVSIHILPSQSAPTILKNRAP